MPEQVAAIEQARNAAPREISQPQSRLYVVVLQKEGWTKRLFLEGRDSAEARGRLGRAISAIYAPESGTLHWLDFLEKAAGILRDEGFTRTGH